MKIIMKKCPETELVTNIKRFSVVMYEKELCMIDNKYPGKCLLIRSGGDRHYIDYKSKLRVVIEPKMLAYEFIRSVKIIKMLTKPK